jgi:hypothetical protein
MNYGEIISSAARFTWRNKALWVPALVVALTALIYSALSGALSISETRVISTRQVIPILLYSMLTMFLSIGYFAFAVFAGAIQITLVLWATLQPAPAEPFTLGAAWLGSKRYYWRDLAILVVFGLAAGILAMPFGCLAILVAIPFSAPLSTTAGVVPANSTPITVALLCFLVPVVILSTGIIEQLLLAIIAEDCSFGTGVQRGFRFIGKNFGIIFLSIIIMGALLFGVILPFGYLPVWLTNKLIETVTNHGSMPQVIGYGIGVLAAGLIYIILSPLIFCFYQSAWASIYRHLTSPPVSGTLVPAENA